MSITILTLVLSGMGSPADAGTVRGSSARTTKATRPAPRPTPPPARTSPTRTTPTRKAPAPRQPTTRAPAPRQPTTRAPAPRQPTTRAPAPRQPTTRAPAPTSRAPQAVSGRLGALNHQAPAPRPGNVVHGADQRHIKVGPPPTPRTRGGTATAANAVGRPPGNAQAPGNAARPSGRPTHRDGRDVRDVRYDRPSAARTRIYVNYSGVRYHRPGRYSYYPYYTGWGCHPYFRYQYSTVAVFGFGYSVYPWYDWWAPPARAGWRWVHGYMGYGYYHPGYWSPVHTAPAGMVYVRGWWEDEVYVDGYYRARSRAGWRWVNGHYDKHGVYYRAHWRPVGPAPDGYAWEAGFWDGEQYVDGFWRPDDRPGFLWASGFYDGDGVFHAAYWLPEHDEPGAEWVPGWFDGSAWQDGYWVDASELSQEAIEQWEPPAEVDDYEDGALPPQTEIIRRHQEETGEAPRALPVVTPAE